MTVERQIDPISISILRSQFQAVLDESIALLVRAAQSVIIREIQDVSQILTDAEGRLLAQSSVSSPGFVGTTSATVKHFLKAFPSWKPGDIAITNDPWLVAGHLPDITIATPIFHGGVRIGFIASTAHMSDIGGTPFGKPTESVFEEGLRIPPFQLQEHDPVGHPVFAFLRANVRTPDAVIGDVLAMIESNREAASRVSQILDGHDLADLVNFHDQLIAASQRALAAAVARIPEGEYASTISGDGYGSPLVISARLKVGGGLLRFDFEGSAAQQPSPINAVLPYTRAYVAYVSKCVLAPEIANSEAIHSLIEVSAPPGSVVHAIDPAPVQSRHIVGCLLQGLLFQIYAQCLPEKSQADSGSPPAIVTFYGTSQSGTPFITYDFVNGGIGARANGHGRSATSFPSNLKNIPIEVHENVAPILYLEQRLIEGSGGAGTFNGGSGQRKVIRALKSIAAAVVFDRSQHPPQGALGGHAATGASATKSGTLLPSKCLVALEPGDELTIQSAGGGGYGPPT